MPNQVRYPPAPPGAYPAHRPYAQEPDDYPGYPGGHAGPAHRPHHAQEPDDYPYPPNHWANTNRPPPMHPAAQDDFRARQPAAPAAPRRPEVTHTSNSPEEAKAKIKAGVDGLRHFEPHAGKLFHSTSSKSWEGLGQAGGLVPATMLKNYNIKRAAGQGDTIIPKEKPAVYFGQGSEGLGTAMSFFDLYKTSVAMSPHLYSNQQLNDKLAKTRYIVRNWDVGDRNFQSHDYIAKLSLEQARSHLRQLETEKELRDSMPHRPRNAQPYPVMFEFNADNGREVITPEKVTGTGRKSMVGEVVVPRPVMFRDHLKRVFVSVDNLEHAQKQMDRILGRGHSVEVVPMESLTQTLNYRRTEGRDPKKANKAKATIDNRNESTYNTEIREARIAELYDQAAASLPSRR
ncbi:hypothetical protein [Cystobacter fuscus]|uniref:hypothetical protein n=1 Tax=Cystobacter fuscus TaxID=43 RepID=UPI0005BA36B6|nr:hypothetical protein [Cystobacter fuscus]